MNARSSWEAQMAQGYVKPEFSPEQVNAAGKVIRRIRMAEAIVTPAEFRRAVVVLDNFRGAHYFPMNTIYMTLKKRAAKIDGKSFPSMRLKQFNSIAKKLWGKEQMKLTQMQDIGGCRATMPVLDQAYSLRDQYVNAPVPSHEFASERFEKDYILEPKASGYRSIHLKYKFQGTAKSLEYRGLKVEIQLRSLIQHRWAVAVEAAGTFTKMDLKSGKGDPNWLRFFALMGSFHALKEGMPLVPDTPPTAEGLRKELRDLNERFYIERTFAEMRTLLPNIRKQKNYRVFVITLDPRNPSDIEVEGFPEDQFVAANEYLKREEARLNVPESPVQVVLVTVSKVSDLERAYPSYFLDTAGFLADVREAVS